MEWETCYLCLSVQRVPSELCLWLTALSGLGLKRPGLMMIAYPGADFKGFFEGIELAL